MKCSSKTVLKTKTDLNFKTLSNFKRDRNLKKDCKIEENIMDSKEIKNANTILNTIIFVVLAGGYIINVLKVAQVVDIDAIGIGMLIVRVCGVLLPPLGGVVGYF